MTRSQCATTELYPRSFFIDKAVHFLSEQSTALSTAGKQADVHAGWVSCRQGFMQTGFPADRVSCRQGFMQAGFHADRSSCRQEFMQAGFMQTGAHADRV